MKPQPQRHQQQHQQLHDHHLLLLTLPMHHPPYRINATKNAKRGLSRTREAGGGRGAHTLILTLTLTLTLTLIGHAVLKIEFGVKGCIRFLRVYP